MAYVGGLRDRKIRWMTAVQSALLYGEGGMGRSHADRCVREATRKSAASSRTESYLTVSEPSILVTAGVPPIALRDGQFAGPSCWTMGCSNGKRGDLQKMLPDAPRLESSGTMREIDIYLTKFLGEHSYFWSHFAHQDLPFSPAFSITLSAGRVGKAQRWHAEECLRESCEWKAQA